MYALTVTRPFADYKAGDLITDQAVIAAVLESNPSSVVRVNAPESKPAESKPI